MSTSYVTVIPCSPTEVPSDEQTESGLEYMENAGWIRPEGDKWFTGTRLNELIDDPRPEQIDGQSVLEAAKHGFFHRAYPFPKGHAGLNLEPIACIHCSSELAFDETMEAILACETGEQDVPREQLTVSCFHCLAPTWILEEDFGISGGYGRFEYRFELATNRQARPHTSAVSSLSDAMGLPMKLIQVLV